MTIPENLKQCYQALKEILPLQEQQEFAKTPFRNLSKYHHSLGLWIRNNWKLWGTEKNPLRDLLKREGIVHPDEMSSHILKYCWSQFRIDQSNIDHEQVRIENKSW